MTDIKIDLATKDLVLSAEGDLVLTEDNGELGAQKVAIGLNMFRGEWFANVLYGIPWVRNKNNLIQLLGTSNKDLIDTYIKELIVSVPEIATLDYDSSVFNKVTRTYTMKFRARTISGEVIDETLSNTF